MFKFISLFALLAVASAAPGYITESHSIVQPAVLAKTAVVDTSSAITHQSYTNLLRKLPVSPVVHTYAAAPIVKTISTPVVHTYAAAPIYQTYSAAPVLKTISSPIVHSYAAHSVPVVKSIASSPVLYTNLHH